MNPGNRPAAIRSSTARILSGNGASQGHAPAKEARQPGCGLSLGGPAASAQQQVRQRLAAFRVVAASQQHRPGIRRCLVRIGQGWTVYGPVFAFLQF